MKKVELDNVAKFINGFAFKPSDWSSDGLKIIRIQNLTNPDKAYNRTTKKVPERYLIKKSDILVSWSATLDVFEWEDNEKALLNQHIFKVEPNEGIIDKKYFKYVLRHSIEKMSQFTHGSTMKHIVRKDFLKHHIPLPSLEDQKSIVKFLDEVDALHQKRKQAIGLLDAYINAIFFDMFVVNSKEKNIQLVQLEKLSLKITDGVHAKPEYTESGIPFISVKNITTTKLTFDDCKFISSEDHHNFTKRCKAEPDDILYTKVGATYGRACVVDTSREFSLYVSVALIKPNKDLIDPIFLKAVLNSSYVKRQADKSVKGAGVPDLHLIEIKKFKIPLPSMKEQKKFSKLVLEVEAIKQNMLVQSDELETQFQALMQKVFNGELYV